MEEDNRQHKDSLNFVIKHYKENSFYPKIAYSKYMSKEEANKSKTKHVKIYRIASIAAVLIFAVLLGYNLSNREDMYYADEISKEIILADNSTTILAKNSKMILKKGFGEKHRNVEMRGDIFFDVSHDTTRPFTVSTPSATLKVLGTSFRVQENSEGTLLQVKSGQVMFAPKNMRVKHICHMGTEAIYNDKNNNLYINNEMSKIYVSENDNEIRFSQVALEDAISIINSHYNKSITVDENDKSRLLSTRFKCNNVNDIIEIINKTLEVNLNIE